MSDYKNRKLWNTDSLYRYDIYTEYNENNRNETFYYFFVEGELDRTFYSKIINNKFGKIINNLFIVTVGGDKDLEISKKITAINEYGEKESIIVEELDGYDSLKKAYSRVKYRLDKITSIKDKIICLLDQIHNHPIKEKNGRFIGICDNDFERYDKIQSGSKLDDLFFAKNEKVDSLTNIVLTDCHDLESFIISNPKIQEKLEKKYSVGILNAVKNAAKLANLHYKDLKKNPDEISSKLGQFRELVQYGRINDNIEIKSTIEKSLSIPLSYGILSDYINHGLSKNMEIVLDNLMSLDELHSFDEIKQYYEDNHSCLNEDFNPNHIKMVYSDFDAANGHDIILFYVSTLNNDKIRYFHISNYISDIYTELYNDDFWNSGFGKRLYKKIIDNKSVAF